MSKRLAAPGFARSLLAWFVPAALGCGLLWPAIQVDLRRARIDATLSALGDALWSYREANGEWPPLHPATAAELVPLLLDQGHLAAPPLNPATNAPYGDDPFEIDRVWYGLEEAGAVFVLEVLDADGVRVLAAKRYP